ncbi:arginase family protein [Salinifilum ghardaiensis]
MGTAVLEAVLPPHDGPTATVPVTMADRGLEQRDGVEAKTVVVEQLARAVEIVRHHDPARITTLGGECSVSVAPFAELARRYGDDLAVVWIDSHLDIGTPRSEYPGYHAMAVAALTGHGHPEVQDLLPATVPPNRVALVGLHSWTDDDVGNIAEWGIPPFSPGTLRETTQPLLDWIAGTGCSRVAALRRRRGRQQRDRARPRPREPGGLTSTEVRRVVADIAGAADVVGPAIAEFLPRQVMHLQQILNGFPLISEPTADRR